MIEFALIMLCVANGIDYDCSDYDTTFNNMMEEQNRFFTFPTYIQRAENHYELWWTHIMPTAHVQAECYNHSMLGVDGCAYIDGQNKIYLTWNSWDRLDAYGQSIYWHEIRHAQCMCNWHE